MANEEAIKKIQALRKIKAMRAKPTVEEPQQESPFKQELVDKLGHDPFAELGGAEPPNPVAGGQVPSPREQAKLGGMVLGEVVGGPPGAAGGYALTDQLLKRFIDGQEITPKGAATSLGVGGLYAAGGPAISKVGRGMKILGETAYHKGVRPTSEFSKQDIAEAIPFGAAKGITATEGAFNKNAERITQLSDMVDSAIAKAQANGASDISITEIFAPIERTLTRVGNSWRAKKDRKIVTRVMQDMIDEHGYNVSIKKAQDMKKEFGRRLHKDYKEGKLNTVEKDTAKDARYGLRQGIEERVPEVAPWNDEMRKRIMLSNMIAKRTATNENQSALGLSDIVAAKAFGAPGFLMRKGASSPGTMTSIGSQLSRRGSNLESLGKTAKPGALYGLQLLLEQELGKGER